MVSLQRLRGVWTGTSGFSYDDWKGEVYPSSLSKAEWFDFYTTQFNTLELNSSFYAFPSEKTVLSLCRRAPSNFLFSVKAHQSITHDKKVENVQPFIGVLKSFENKGFFPLALFQFPFSFHCTQDNKDYLDRCLQNFPFAISVEFRNQEWVQPVALKELQEKEISVVSVDEPALKGLMPKTLFSSEILYLRFHGRNKEKWWNPDNAFERYDYSYTKEELEEWVVPFLQADASVKVVYFNNHFRGQAVRNAKMFSAATVVQSSQGTL